MLDTAKLLARGFLPYRKKTITFAKQMPARFHVQLESGDVIHGQPGDYACVSPDDQGRWIVAQDIFQKIYTPADPRKVRARSLETRLRHDGFRPYRKPEITWARKIERPRVVHTLEGDVIAEAGDYLCLGPKGEPWPQKPDRFERHYERVPVPSRSR